MVLENLLPIIESLPLKEALALLISQGVISLSKDGYERIRDLIQKKTSEKTFGFVPNPDEDNFLKKASEKIYYQEFGNYLPNHRYSDYIRVGYLISHLNRIGGQVNRERVNEIIESIKDKPNGVHNVKVMYMVSTGAIAPIISYLSDLKMKNFDSDYIASAFDEIIYEWQSYTIFVRTETEQKAVYQEILHRVENKQKLIMVFSYGNAKTQTTLAVARLLNERKTEGYFYESNNNTEGEKEVHSSTFKLM